MSSHRKLATIACPSCNKARPWSSFPDRILVKGVWVPNRDCDHCVRDAQGLNKSVTARPQPMPGKQR